MLDEASIEEHLARENYLLGLDAKNKWFEVERRTVRCPNVYRTSSSLSAALNRKGTPAYRFVEMHHDPKVPLTKRPQQEDTDPIMRILWQKYPNPRWNHGETII